MWNARRSFPEQQRTYSWNESMDVPMPASRCVHAPLLTSMWAPTRGKAGAAHPQRPHRPPRSLLKPTVARQAGQDPKLEGQRLRWRRCGFRSRRCPSEGTRSRRGCPWACRRRAAAAAPGRLLGAAARRSSRRQRVPSTRRSQSGARTATRPGDIRVSISSRIEMRT